MDLRKTEPRTEGFENFLDNPTDGVAATVTSGLPRAVSEALADPIVQALMAADRVDANELTVLLQRAALRLARIELPDRSEPPTGHPVLCVNPALDTENETVLPASDRIALRFDSIRSWSRTAVGPGLSRLAQGFVLAVVVLAGLSAAPRPAAADAPAAAFIHDLGEQAVSIIHSAAPLPEKAGWFAQMIRQDFDLTNLCQFELGPYWRAASSGERAQFCSALADRLVRVYGRQLADAGDGVFVVTGSGTAPDGVIVTSRIIRPQGAAIAIDWRLGVSDGVYKIEDVAIDGVSMALSERATISDLIGREGGQVAAVLATLRD
jgi:phospholipid transport system substrate-binding protein